MTHVPQSLNEFQNMMANAHNWSLNTFGPGPRMEGVLDHIAKESEEVALSGGSGDEWIDLVILSIDGFLREKTQRWGLSRHDAVAELLRMWAEKTEINMARDWPDFRTMDPNKAVEHVRGGGAEQAAHDAEEDGFQEAMEGIAKLFESAGFTVTDINPVGDGFIGMAERKSEPGTDFQFIPAEEDFSMEEGFVDVDFAEDAQTSAKSAEESASEAAASAFAAGIAVMQVQMLLAQMANTVDRAAELLQKEAENQNRGDMTELNVPYRPDLPPINFTKTISA